MNRKKLKLAKQEIVPDFCYWKTLSKNPFSNEVYSEYKQTVDEIEYVNGTFRTKFTTEDFIELAQIEITDYDSAQYRLRHRGAWLILKNDNADTTSGNSYINNNGMLIPEVDLNYGRSIVGFKKEMVLAEKKRSATGKVWFELKKKDYVELFRRNFVLSDRPYWGVTGISHQMAKEMGYDSCYEVIGYVEREVMYTKFLDRENHDDVQIVEEDIMDENNNVLDKGKDIAVRVAVNTDRVIQNQEIFVLNRDERLTILQYLLDKYPIEDEMDLEGSLEFVFQIRNTTDPLQWGYDFVDSCAPGVRQRPTVYVAHPKNGQVYMLTIGRIDEVGVSSRVRFGTPQHSLMIGNVARRLIHNDMRKPHDQRMGEEELRITRQLTFL